MEHLPRTRRRSSFLRQQHCDCSPAFRVALFFHQYSCSELSSLADPSGSFVALPLRGSRTAGLWRLALTTYNCTRYCGTWHVP